MSKILIIGVGGGGILAVENMKKEGIPEANYIGIGFEHRTFAKNIPYYDLKEMNECQNLPVYASKVYSRQFAENVEKEIGEIIDKHLNEESK